MNQNDYVRLSLELHLFFDRIMKEHSFFLETAFTDKNKNFKNIARDFQQNFSILLAEITNLANNNVSEEFLMANEMITKNTLEAERKTSDLSEVPIDTNITQKQQQLKSGITDVNRQLVNTISNINQQTLPLIKNLIEFKTDILNSVLSCKMYTTNYPLLIEHIIHEAKMYYNLLTRIENRQIFDENYIYEQELFWNDIMKEHAEFIRGLLDPTEKELIFTANKYAQEYEVMIQQASNYPTNLTNLSLNETINFRDFKIVGEEGILNCKIRSIIVPLLADHVLREANHFIRILRNVKR